MNFWIQKSSDLDIECQMLKNKLSSGGNRYMHNFKEVETLDLKDVDWNNGINIPIGNLDFIGAYLELVKGNSYMKPIEIPSFLQKPQYLKRFYGIFPYKDLPKKGSYFIKNAHLLKAWTLHSILMEYFDEVVPKFNGDYKSYEYVVTKEISIQAEYRVFVHNDKAVGVMWYSGDVLKFPDVNIITEVLNDITLERLRGTNFPKSYTIDLAVTEYGTCLLELHNFVSCGVYGFDEDVILYMYRDGIEFELSR